MALSRLCSPVLMPARNAQDGPDVRSHPTLPPSRNISTARHLWTGPADEITASLADHKTTQNQRAHPEGSRRKEA